MVEVDGKPHSHALSRSTCHLSVDEVQHLTKLVSWNVCSPKMCKHQQRAGCKAYEDELLHFLVNRLDEEASLNFANNAEADAEDIYDILVGGTADGILISTLCDAIEDSPSANTLYICGRSSSRSGSKGSLISLFDGISLNYSPKVSSTQTSTSALTTVTKTTQTPSIIRDQVRNYCVRRICHALRTREEQIRAVSKTTTPAAAFSLSFFEYSTYLIPRSRSSP